MLERSSPRVLECSSPWVLKFSSAQVLDCSSLRVTECSSPRVLESSSELVLDCSSPRVLESSSPRVLESSSARLLESSSARVLECSSPLVLEFSSARVLESSYSGINWLDGMAGSLERTIIRKLLFIATSDCRCRLESWNKVETVTLLSKAEVKTCWTRNVQNTSTSQNKLKSNCSSSPKVKKTKTLIKLLSMHSHKLKNNFLRRLKLTKGSVHYKETYPVCL